MTVTSLLDLRFATDHLEDGPRALLDILADTRAFDGCLGVQVVTDVTDPHTCLRSSTGNRLSMTRPTGPGGPGPALRD